MINIEKEEKNKSVLTEKMDTDSKEFNEFQARLFNTSQKRSKDQKRDIDLLALRFRMEDYTRSSVDQSETVGGFLKSYLKTLGIRQNKFANYIGLKPSNLSKILNGERTMSYELALIIGNIFGTDPMLWLEVQNKNKLSELSKKEAKVYSLEDLLTV